MQEFGGYLELFKMKILNKELKKRFERNLNVFQITLKEVEQKKEVVELSFPESVVIKLNGKIDYKESLKNLKEVIKSLKKRLTIPKAKDSGIIKEREIKLEKHLEKLRNIREKRKQELKEKK